MRTERGSSTQSHEVDQYRCVMTVLHNIAYFGCLRNGLAKYLNLCANKRGEQSDRYSMSETASAHLDLSMRSVQCDGLRQRKVKSTMSAWAHSNYTYRLSLHLANPLTMLYALNSDSESSRYDDSKESGRTKLNLHASSGGAMGSLRGSAELGAVIVELKMSVC